jgi:excisionase family DNA binding protein
MDHDGLTRRPRKEVGVERLLLTAEETAEILSIGRTKVYELMRLGLIESVKIHGCRRIPTEAVHNYVDRLRRTPWHEHLAQEQAVVCPN